MAKIVYINNSFFLENSMEATGTKSVICRDNSGKGNQEQKIKLTLTQQQATCSLCPLCLHHNPR